MLNSSFFALTDSQIKLCQAVLQSGAHCANLLVSRAHDHEHGLILSLDFLPKAISSTRRKHGETLTSMSSIYCFCLLFSSSFLAMLSVSTVNDLHTQMIKIRHGDVTDELLMLTKFVKWNGRRLLVWQIFDRAFKDEIWWSFACMWLAVNSNTKCFEIIQLDNFVVQQSVNINFNHRVRAQNRS